MITEKPTPEQVIAAREAAGLSRSEAAARFGMVYNAWQKKETTGTSGTKLSVGEYNYLLLLANKHPEYQIVHRLPENESFQQKAAQAALDLAIYLASGSSTGVVLPTVVKAMENILHENLEAFQKDWMNDLNSSVGDSLPLPEDIK